MLTVVKSKYHVKISVEQEMRMSYEIDSKIWEFVQYPRRIYIPLINNFTNIIMKETFFFNLCIVFQMANKLLSYKVKI